MSKHNYPWEHAEQKKAAKDFIDKVADPTEQKKLLKEYRQRRLDDMLNSPIFDAILHILPMWRTRPSFPAVLKSYWTVLCIESEMYPYDVGYDEVLSRIKKAYPELPEHYWKTIGEYTEIEQEDDADVDDDARDEMIAEIMEELRPN